MNVLDFQKFKIEQKKISMVTCYDFWTAQILNASNIDALLVGDSAAMVVHGHPSTLTATPELIAVHIEAVVKGAPDKFIIGDLPFLCHRKGLSSAMNAVEILMRAGCHAVKIEEITGHEEIIFHICQSGIPVMGHLGLTPQSIHHLGGHKVQGRGEAAEAELLEKALKVQQAGCFALVLECVPQKLAQLIHQELRIPVIGIGAGVEVDGQVLVLQDLVGMNPSFRPKFLRPYLKGYEMILSAINSYDSDVKQKKFPNKEESYL